MFVGSPLVEVPAAELVKLGKQLKKNNVAVDVINFGQENATNDNAEKLEQLISAVNTADNSHLVNIPPGPHILSDLILSSPIMNDAGGAAGGVGAAGGTAGGVAGAIGAAAGRTGAGGGVDPNEDPEMAMAIRMSMEEERQRQQKAAGGGAAPAAGTAAATTTTTAAAGGDSAAVPMEQDDEEALLAQAIALSMQQEEPGPAPVSLPSVTSGPGLEAPGPGPSSAAPPEATGDNTDINAVLMDPDFVNSLLAGTGGEAGAGDAGQVQLDSLLDQLTGGTAGAGAGAGAAAAAGQQDKSKEEKKDTKDEEDKSK